MNISSFTRSFINCVSRNNASPAFIARAIAAAKKRYPDLKMTRSKKQIVYSVPSEQNCTILLITW